MKYKFQEICFFVPTFHQIIETKFPLGSFIMHLISHHDTERSTNVCTQNAPTPGLFYVTFYTVREEEEGVQMGYVMNEPVG
jgi:hypothetical protein